MEKQELADAEFTLATIQRLLKAGKDVYTIADTNYEIEKITGIGMMSKGSIEVKTGYAWWKAYKTNDIDNGLVTLKKLPAPFGKWVLASEHAFRVFLRNEKEKEEKEEVKEEADKKDEKSIYSDMLPSTLERLRKAQVKLWLLDDEFYDSEKPIHDVRVRTSSMDFLVGYNYPQEKSVKFHVYPDDMYSKMRLKKQPNGDYFVVVDNETR